MLVLAFIPHPIFEFQVVRFQTLANSSLFFYFPRGFELSGGKRLYTVLQYTFSKLFNFLFSYVRYECLKLQLNLFNTDIKGTEPSVRFTELSVLSR